MPADRDQPRHCTSAIQLACALTLGCASAAAPTFSGMDASSGRKLTLTRGELAAPDAIVGSYYSPQLGDLELTRGKDELGRDTIEGGYAHAHTGCAMRGRLRGELRGNEVRFRLVEWAEDPSPRCKPLEHLRGRGFFFFDVPRSVGAPSQLLGKRHFERPLEWANPNVDRFDERTFSAVKRDVTHAAHAAKSEPAPDLESDQRVAAPPEAECVQVKSSRKPPTCGRVPHLPARAQGEAQLRIDALTRVLGAVRGRAETACPLDPSCDRNASPWQPVFAALAAAEHGLLVVQQAGDAYAQGDGRLLDLARPCLAQRLTRLLEALRSASQSDVAGLRELLPAQHDAACSYEDPFPVELEYEPARQLE